MESWYAKQDLVASKGQHVVAECCEAALLVPVRATRQFNDQPRSRAEVDDQVRDNLRVEHRLLTECEIVQDRAVSRFPNIIWGAGE